MWNKVDLNWLKEHSLKMKDPGKELSMPLSFFAFILNSSIYSSHSLFWGHLWCTQDSGLYKDKSETITDFMFSKDRLRNNENIHTHQDKVKSGKCLRKGA